MDVGDEIKHYGCALSGQSFNEVLEEEFLKLSRNCTPDEMLTRWWDSKKFCLNVCRRLGMPTDGVADEMILRRLLNLRKRGESGLQSRAHGGSKALAKVLDELSIPVDPQGFRDVIRSFYKSLHRHWPVEPFLAHWRSASHFCGVIAASLGVERTKAVDHLVLKTLLNIRRTGGLNRKERLEV